MTTENNSIRNSTENQPVSVPSTTASLAVAPAVAPGAVIISSSMVPANGPKPTVLAPGQWARVVLGFEAPFGFDKMPTVLG